MWGWLSGAIYGSAVVWFLSLWLLRRFPGWLCLACGVCGGLTLGILGQFFLPWAVCIAIPLGMYLGFVLVGWFQKKQNIPLWTVLALSSLGPWLPFCQQEPGQANAIVAAVAACGMMMAAGFLPERGRERRMEGTAFFPLLVVPVSVLPMTGLMTMSPVTACTGLLGLLGLCIFLSEQLRAKREALQKNEMMARWQQESRDYMNLIRSQRHDFNFHLHAISGLAKIGDVEPLQQYVSKLVAEATAVNDIMPVADAVVGSMLYNMRQEARAHGSEIYYHITYDMADVLCNGFMVNKILGNLLQNAMDALLTREAKEYGIHLRIFKRRGNTVISVENYFDADPMTVARVFEPGYSTKRNHEGIGLSMVLRAAEQCGGRVYPEFEEKRIRFVVNLPNQVTLQGGEEA